MRMDFSLAMWFLCLGLIFVESTRADDQLIAHWPLVADANDRATHALHGQATDVRFDDSATFNGRNSVIEIATGDSLKLGAEPFTVALWMHTEKSLDDTLGDLLGKFDPHTRRGFNLSVMNYAGVTSSQSNFRNVHFGIDGGTTPPEWIDHGQLGEAMLIFSLAVHDGQLFAGTCEAGPQQAGRVFRYDGRTWTDCGNPDQCNSVTSLAVYDGALYAASGKYRLAGSALAESENPHQGGGIYRYDDGNWTPCGRLPETQSIGSLVVYRGRLYASSMYAPAGFFRYEGGTEWTSCGTPEGKRVESMTVYNGHIYATGYDEGAVYRYDGQSWEHLGKIDGASQTYGFATHRGDLYVSEWPNARVFRWDGAGHWLPAGRLGEEKESMPLIVYNGKMYAGTLPTAEVYRFDDPEWTKVARLDFTPDVMYRRVWSMAAFQGRLFAGTLPSGRVHSVEVGRNVTNDAALPSGWVHLTAVRDETELRLYVDGKLVARSAPFVGAEFDLTNDQPLTIGFGAHDYWNGKLKDVRVYRGTLSDKSITSLAGAR